MFSAGEDNPIEESSTKEGLMLLIEFEDTAGLENFVSEMHDRDIPGLLVVSYEFAEEHADVLKELNKYGIEIWGYIFCCAVMGCKL
jgi:tryptophan synthase alpha subunit